jgi:uncharacterized phiE125 gp8 family phage protein
VAIVCSTPPSVEPYTANELKESHLRITTSDDDVYIELLIAAARRSVEQQTNRALITQTFTYTRTRFPDGRVIQLERPPLRSVTSVKYYDSANTQQTLSPTVYTVDTAAAPGRIVLNYGQSWPTTYDRPAAIEVIYQAGYGSAGSSVPEDLRHAIAFLVAHWYRQREPINIGNIVTPMPLTFDWLIGPHRVYV